MFHVQQNAFVVETLDGQIDISAASVEQWVDLDPQVELVLKRKSDGLEIVFAPNAESYRALVAKGAVVFTPGEVLKIIEAKQIANERGFEKGFELAELLDGVVKLKQTFPGAKLGELNDKGSGS